MIPLWGNYLFLQHNYYLQQNLVVAMGFFYRKYSLMIKFNLKIWLSIETKIQKKYTTDLLLDFLLYVDKNVSTLSWSINSSSP